MWAVLFIILGILLGGSFTGIFYEATRQDFETAVRIESKRRLDQQATDERDNKYEKRRAEYQARIRSNAAPKACPITNQQCELGCSDTTQHVHPDRPAQAVCGLLFAPDGRDVWRDPHHPGP